LFYFHVLFFVPQRSLFTADFIVTIVTEHDFQF